MLPDVLSYSRPLTPLSTPHAILKHAANVAQDATTLPWPAVRAWTQACVANIEEGKATWHNTDCLTSDRRQQSWINGCQMETKLIAPCPDFNADQCKEKATHSTEGRTWTHLCTLCLYATGEEKPTHGAHACWKKNSRSNDDPKPDQKHSSFGYQNKKKPKTDP